MFYRLLISYQQKNKNTKTICLLLLGFCKGLYLCGPLKYHCEMSSCTN